MLQPIPGLLIRPIVGAVTDKYKCRRSVFIASSIIMFVLVCLLSIIPGTTAKEEINDLDVIKSPIFWMFCTTIALIGMVAMSKAVLEDTICMDLLGKNKYCCFIKLLMRVDVINIYASELVFGMHFFSVIRPFKNLIIPIIDVIPYHHTSCIMSNCPSHQNILEGK